MFKPKQERFPRARWRIWRAVWSPWHKKTAKSGSSEAQKYLRGARFRAGPTRGESAPFTLATGAEQPYLSVPLQRIAGDSTVTNQIAEPWAGWGQMLPRFFDADVAVANHAESGEPGSHSPNPTHLFRK